MNMRVGILGHGFIEWGGGLDFLRGICGSLAAVDAGIEMHLLLPVRGPRLRARRGWRLAKHGVKRMLHRPSTLGRMPDLRLVREVLVQPGRNLQVHEIDVGTSAIDAASRRLGLQVLLPSVQPFDARVSVPWLGYIADFQHRHLPQFFHPTEIAARNSNFAAMLSSARGVIVNARAVAQDIATFLPGGRATVTALPFSAAPDPAWLGTTPPPLQAYDVAARYFIISNQFWQHKDHLTAWRAFGRLLPDYGDVQLVCTGETSDFRNPDHFPALCRAAQELGISERVRILGLIPKQDQIALLRGALAVVQPTRFEGGPGGGSVFDAVALGVPAIASNIAVNVEIDEPTVTFFEAGDAGALADRLAERLRIGHVPPPPATRLIDAGQRRRRACGEALLGAIDLVRASRS